MTYDRHRRHLRQRERYINSEAHIHDCQQLFVRGDYTTVIANYFDRPVHKLTVVELPWVVGSLCFTGRLAEAEALYRRHTIKEPETASACRYFLAIAHLRHNEHHSWKNASTLLIENIKAARKADREKTGDDDLAGSILNFYAAQGIGFARYRSGRLKPAEYWAEKAQKAAVAADFLYGRVFSGDLLGHVRVNSGQVRRGLREFERVFSLAEALGQGAITQGIAGTLAIYRARYGVNSPQAADEELKNRISLCSFEDSYTLASLHLERARLCRLSGRTSEERACLDAAIPLIYGIKSSHLEAQLNIRLAMPLLQAGNARQALDMIRHSLSLIERKDILLTLKLRGIEHRSLLALGKLAEADTVHADIVSLTRRSGQKVASRILNRTQNIFQSDAMRGDDPLGDLIDEARRKPCTDLRRISADIFASGWTGLLYETLNIPINRPLIVFDLEYGALTLFDHGDVIHISGGISALARRFVEALAGGPKSKEQLIATVWQLRYHPLKHDSLIYALVAKLRRSLGLRADWVLATEEGYQLPPDTQVLSASAWPNPLHTTISELPRTEPSIAMALATTPAFRTAPAKRPFLNHRQETIKRMVQAGEYFDIQRGVAEFGASDATISRDLSQLLELGIVERVGKGRATKYRNAEQKFDQENFK